MSMACSKVFSGLVGVPLNMLVDATIVCNKVVVAASSHHRSPGSITRESQTRHGQQSRPIRLYVTTSQEAKLSNFDILNPW